MVDPRPDVDHPPAHDVAEALGCAEREAPGWRRTVEDARRLDRAGDEAEHAAVLAIEVVEERVAHRDVGRAPRIPPGRGGRRRGRRSATRGGAWRGALEMARDEVGAKGVILRVERG